MKQHNNAWHHLKNLLDLSVPTVAGIPIVEMAGNQRVLIENHNGVVEYGTTKIVILVKIGKIVVSGSNMEICHMSRQQLVITGCIDSVSVERGCN